MEKRVLRMGRLGSDSGTRPISLRVLVEISMRTCVALKIPRLPPLVSSSSIHRTSWLIGLHDCSCRSRGLRSKDAIVHDLADEDRRGEPRLVGILSASNGKLLVLGQSKGKPNGVIHICDNVRIVKAVQADKQTSNKTHNVQSEAR